MLIRLLILLLFSLQMKAHAIDITQVNPRTLYGKKVAYYFGSFDPFHLGHLEVTDRLLHRVDYVLILPTGIADQRKPNRTDPLHRREMISSLFSENPCVLTSVLSAGELQAYLEPHLKEITFYGVQGSEVLDEFQNPSQKSLKLFLSGRKIPPELTDTALAAMMMIPSKTLFMPLRTSNSQWREKTHFHHFNLIPLPISERSRKFSSTQIRNKTRKGEKIHGLAPPEVEIQIREKAIYR